MKKLTRILSYVLVATLASALTFFALGFVVLQSGSDQSQSVKLPQAVSSQSKLDQLADLIEERFIGEANRTEYEDAAAAAMVDALGDRWSYYIPADQFQAHVETMENAYVGIGVTILVMEDASGFEITKVNKGSPAEEAGILPGDVIVTIAGHSAAGMTAEDARNLVRGEENTEVILGIQRDGKVMDLSVMRKRVLNPVAEYRMLEQNIGLVTIFNFDERCASETITAIESLLEEGAQAIIFDVRNNPGGYKHELVKVLDYLLPEGPLFRSEDYQGKVSVDESDAKCLDIPMAVLVNSESYSAAEFFAAALSEYDAAIVVGQQTSGKGYFQTTIQLKDGSAVGLSVGKYTTPRGVSLADVGITPDIPVDVDDETFSRIYAGICPVEEDPQIQAALETLKTGQ